MNCNDVFNRFRFELYIVNKKYELGMLIISGNHIPEVIKQGGGKGIDRQWSRQILERCGWR